MKNVTKTFGKFNAVDNTSFDVYEGEFFSMLGPSGSGKTTMLRMIAGFDLPTSGQILLDNQDVSKLAPFQRNINTVFQDYALFPHLTVQKNVEYGLACEGISRKIRKIEASEMLQKVQLDHLSTQKPAQLSGGQKQRVALARALVKKPKVLLLDEPLSALDLKLRHTMQYELKQIQRDVGITFIFVTHDQEEALTMSDRIAIFNNGKIEQIGTPNEIYQKPKSEFVASFVGSSNIFSEENSRSILVRPEHIYINDKTKGKHTLSGKIVNIQFAGPLTRIQITLNNSKIITTTQQSELYSNYQLNDEVDLYWDKQSELA